MKVMMVLALALGGIPACDSGGGEHMARCEAACSDTPDPEACSDFDVDACAASCVAQTDGLPAVCAQCMIENGEWDVCACFCNQDGDCDLCCGGVCFPPEPGSTCDPAQESCDFRLGSSSSSACQTACAP